MCAAKGKLHGQGVGNEIRFAYPPGRLTIAPGKTPADAIDAPGLPKLPAKGWIAHQPLGATNSYSQCSGGPSRCYWSGDIFHLEVCLLSAICDNGAEIFKLELGQAWHCKLSEARLKRLKGWMLSK